MKKYNIFLVLLFLFLTISQTNHLSTTNAQSTMTGNVSSNTSDIKNETTSRGAEIKELRRRNSKSYLSSDNSITEKFSNFPIHYLTSDGNWADIDNSITSVDKNKSIEFEDQTNGNDFKVQFGGANNPKVKFFNDNFSIEYTPLNTNQKTTKQKTGNKVSFLDLWGNAALNYTVLNDQLKTNIKLEDKTALSEFKFYIQTKDVTPTLDDKGEILFKDKDDQIASIIPRMWVSESNNKNRLYDRLTTHISEVEDGYLLTISVDDHDLLYPLVINSTTAYETNYISIDNDNYKFNVNIPDLTVDRIKEIYVENTLYDIEVHDPIEEINAVYPMDVYVTETDALGTDLFDIHKSPDVDGTLGVKIGQTDEYGLDDISIINQKSFNQASLVASVPSSKLIKGVALHGTRYHEPSFISVNVYVTYTIPEDHQAPTAPTNVRVVNKTSTSVDLAWTPSTDNVRVLQYGIYNGTQLIGKSWSNSFTVNGLKENMIYTFSVKSWDESYNTSDASNVVVFPSVTNYKTYYYDQLGRLIRIEVLPSNQIIDYEYDKNGNLISIKYR